MDRKTLQSTPPWEWPEGTAERLLGILQDRRADDGDRLVAASLAGDTTVMNDEIADSDLGGSPLLHGQPKALEVVPCLSLGGEPVAVALPAAALGCLALE